MTGQLAFNILASVFLGCLGLWFTCCLLAGAAGDEDEDGAAPTPLFDRDGRIAEFAIIRTLTTTPPGVTREYLDQFGRDDDGRRAPRRRSTHPGI